MSKFKMPEKPARNVESWVTGEDTPATIKPDQGAANTAPAGKLARLTIDLPPELHARFKATCALKGTRMIDQVRGFIEDWTQKNT
jgi:hypothetical protein